MRCEDLTRELASPTGHLSSAEMAEHIAGCPSCAGWSRQAAKLDQIWEATRPIEPTADAMDALWASASLAINEQMVPATLRLEGLSHRRNWLRPSLIAAQVAAAVLLASLLLLRQGGNEPVKVAVTPPIPVPVEPVKVAVESQAPGPVVPVHLVAELDKPLLVSIDKENGYTVSHIAFPNIDSSMLPDNTPHDFFSAVESEASLASPSLAIR